MSDDAELNRLLAEADRAFRADELNECVRAYADAYLRVLETQPRVRDLLLQVLDHPSVRTGLEKRMIRNAPLMWPRFGAKLHHEDGEFSISIDRKQMSFSETVQYQGFMENLMETVNKGDIKVDMNRIGVGM